MKPPPKAPAAPGATLPARIFAACFGAFLGLSLLKFGNPPIMEKWVTTPDNIWEFLLGYPWPISWAYWMLAFLSLFGLVIALNLPLTRTPTSAQPPDTRPSPLVPRPSPLVWLIALPLLWLLWQCFSAMNSVDGELSKATLKHFAACVVCFYLGFFSMRTLKSPWPFWFGL